MIGLCTHFICSFYLFFPPSNPKSVPFHFMLCPSIVLQKIKYSVHKALVSRLTYKRHKRNPQAIEFGLIVYYCTNLAGTGWSIEINHVYFFWDSPNEPYPLSNSDIVDDYIIKFTQNPKKQTEWTWWINIPKSHQCYNFSPFVMNTWQYSLLSISGWCLYDYHFSLLYNQTP